MVTILRYLPTHLEYMTWICIIVNAQYVRSILKSYTLFYWRDKGDFNTIILCVCVGIRSNLKSGASELMSSCCLCRDFFLNLLQVLPSVRRTVCTWQSPHCIVNWRCMHLNHVVHLIALQEILKLYHWQKIYQLLNNVSRTNSTSSPIKHL